MSSKMWDEIIYTFPNFNGWSLGMGKWFHPSIYNGFNYLYMVGLKLIHISKALRNWGIGWYSGILLLPIHRYSLTLFELKKCPKQKVLLIVSY